MGNAFTKPVLPNQPPLRQLQHKILRYIYHDHDDNQDPKEILKSYQKSGHVASSLEHFLENIPHDIWKQYDESVDKNKYHVAEIGSRFVVHNDEGVRIRGKCIGIQIRIRPDVKSSSPEIFIELKLDSSPNSGLSQPLVKTYNINELSLEKIYLQKHLQSNEPLEKSENLNPSLKTKLHSPPPETSKKKKPNSIKVTNQNETLESDKVTICTADSVKLYSVPSTLLNNTSPSYQILKRSFTKKTNTNKANSQPRHGENKGIHGANNSCYMDSILFSLFYTTQEFDPVFITRKEQDSDDAAELRQILSGNVVIPLRTDFYVASSNLAELRKCLSKFDDRFQGAMMDIEELLYLLLEDILIEPHFLQYNNGTKDFIHQILTDDDEECSKKVGEIVTLQSVLENSFKLWGDLKLLQRPNPAFLIQFPRSDGDMIHFDGILPNKFLNFGGILDKKLCSFCLVDCEDFWECRTCRNNELQSQRKYYCEKCMNTNFETVLEQHEAQHDHRPQLINGNKMKLHAIICIKSAHYTSIVKCEDRFGKNNCDWFYFDSMSGSGPEVTLLHDFETKLTKAETSILKSSFSSSTHDQFVLKAMNDCHICIYLPINWTE